MAGTTAKLAFPYPTGTDRVADGDNAIQALAQKIEDLLASTAWTNMTLENAWTNVDASLYGAAAYRKVGDIVECRGLVGSATTTGTLFTLPAGFRPLKTYWFPGDTNNSGGNIQAKVVVNNLGQIFCERAATWVSLYTIRFSIL